MLGAFRLTASLEPISVSITSFPRYCTRSRGRVTRHFPLSSLAAPGSGWNFPVVELLFPWFSDRDVEAHRIDACAKATWWPGAGRCHDSPWGALWPVGGRAVLKSWLLEGYIKPWQAGGWCRKPRLNLKVWAKGQHRPPPCRPPGSTALTSLSGSWLVAHDPTPSGAHTGPVLKRVTQPL